MRTHDFILQAATLLKAHPHLVRKLDIFLHAAAVEERLQVIPHPNSSTGVELIVMSAPSRGVIYELSDSPSQRPQWAQVASTAALRSILRQNSLCFDLTKATPSASWACALTELLQNEIKYSADTTYRAMCMDHLQRLTKRFGILPPSFFVHDMSREGTHIVAGEGFFDVYKSTLSGSPVCLKVLRFFPLESGMREKLLKNCCREALVWKQLDHPNVRPFLGVSVELFAPSFCLVSPWMSNGNLIEYLRAQPEFNRLHAISEIAAAMQYLHEYSPSIVHADIRGKNVLIRDDLRCCLADFGMTSVAESSPTSPSIIGSIRWMAPECFDSANDNCLKKTTRDIYAFGCTVYEVYMGVPPFSQYRLDFPVILDVLAGCRPQRTSGLFSDEIWAMIEACWSHQPSDRPSAAMVVRALQQPSSQTSFWNRPTITEGLKFQVQNDAPDSETSPVSSGRSLIEAVESNERPTDNIVPLFTQVVPGNEKGKISLAVQSGNVSRTSGNFTPPALPDRGIQGIGFFKRRLKHVKKIEEN
ncbi:kinase-like domain-containing protein [Mycena floridula]|nr:kinase-like domain-containing protein [Mycena floridula]